MASLIDRFTGLGLAPALGPGRVPRFGAQARLRRARAALVASFAFVGLVVASALPVHPVHAQGVAPGNQIVRDGEKGAAPLRVLAAASLTEVVEALAKDFDGGPVATSFGASSDLARQIEDGAPADVFVSASPEWIAFLREAKVVVGEPVLVARNALVCVAPKGSRLAGAAADPRALLAHLAADDLVAIADAGVPAGDYARKALAKLGVAGGFEKRLVGQKDVRAVLHAVEQGEVAAGFVYATDAKIGRVETLFAFDPSSHPPIEYHAVALRQAANPEAAKRFLAHLAGARGRARLSAAGFVLP